jgi:hypothetical protein
VCYHALAGVPPYRAAAPAAPAALGDLVPTAPAALLDAIVAGLHPDPRRRPTAAEFGRALFASCTPQPVRLVRATTRVAVELTRDAAREARPVVARDAMRAAAPADAPPAGRHRWSRPRRLFVQRLALVGLALGLLASAIGGGVVWASHDHPAAASPAPSAVAIVARAPSAPSLPAAAAPSLTPGPSTRAVAPATPAPDWFGVLSALDATRDQAFVDADPAALDRVYVAASPALTADRATLGRLVAAGEYARGLRLQLVSVSVAAQGAAEVTLAVRDVLPGYDLVDADGTAEHIAGRAERGWLVVLSGSPWRIAAITAP